ncbi:MAG: metallophosphoesterase family protein [Chitinophagales bacterium]|nr:metallophosphoesterase family protein [Chitinophagales bacterium]
MANRWAITDIHGCSRTFKRLIKKLDLKPEDELYLLGDYIDRGPNSRKVIKQILKLQAAGLHVRCLRGNREDMLLRTLEDPLLIPAWTRNGGRATLKSFKVKKAADIKEKYLHFMRELEYYIVLDDFVLVHAGLNFIEKDPFADKHAMLWLRSSRIIPAKIGHRRLLHGHTPTPLKRIRETLKKKSAIDLNIDNGCVYANVADKGNLVALELNTLELMVQKNVDLPISNRIAQVSIKIKK